MESVSNSNNYSHWVKTRILKSYKNIPYLYSCPESIMKQICLLLNLVKWEFIGQLNDCQSPWHWKFISHRYYKKLKYIRDKNRNKHNIIFPWNSLFQSRHILYRTYPI